jgi:hypothetical protein
LDSAQGASSDMGLDFRLSGFKFCGKELPGRGKFIPSEGEDLLAPPTVDRANQDKGQTNQMQIALAPLVSASRDVAESIRGGTHARHVTFHFYSDDGKCTVTGEFNKRWKDFVLKTWKDSMYSGAFPCEDEELEGLSNKVTELWFSIANMGTQPMRQLADMPIEVIASQAPEKERPIKVRVYAMECPDFISREIASKIDKIFD